MSKLLHSISESYTALDAKERLGRGLLDPPISPEHLPDHLAEEYKLVLRQTIAVLDKIIGKSATLRGISTDVYLHRRELGKALWAILQARFAADQAPKSAIAELSRKWQAKVHPYAKHPIEDGLLSNDKNYKELERQEEKLGKLDFQDFLKKWAIAFWPEPGQPVKYQAIAKAIIDHLSEQELTIEKGEPRVIRKGRPETPPETEKGLMQERGEAIAQSANDPRRASNKLKRKWADSDKKQEGQASPPIEEAKQDTRSKAQQTYFAHADVADDIYNGVTNIEGRNERVYNAWFGDKTYTHFGVVLKASYPKDDSDREALWNLHNAVRRYYKKLATSQKFRRALREVEDSQLNPQSERAIRAKTKLQALLPKDEDQLMARLDATVENADMSQAIRLGKMLVHAAITTEFGAPASQDGAAADQTAQRRKAFNERLDFYATSAGQSEIKRTETFARIWRQSNAMATRTLASLTSTFDKDIHAADVSRNVATGSSDAIRKKLPLIFGAKDAFGDGDTRSAVFLPDDEITQNEIVWALIRLGAGIRNATNHFNVRDRLLKLMKRGIVELEDNPVPIEGRSSGQGTSQVIHADALLAMQKLFEFDKKMRKHAFRTQLIALKANEFLDLADLKKVVRELGKGPEFKQLPPPRFMAVLNHIHALDENKDTQVHANLAPFLSVKKEKRGIDPALDNMCRKGLFQLLYETGFQAWFAGVATDEAHYREITQTVIDQKNERADTYERTVGRKTIPSVSEMAETLGLQNYTNFKSLFEALAKQAIRETDQDTRYRADKVVQSAVASRIEKFRQEVFAHLFARYVQDFDFISEIKERTSTDLDAAMSEYVDTTLPEIAPWHPQFYTWLYLVPPSEISKLRHQMRKSVALETKHQGDSDADAEQMLREMDNLMGLYTQVQAAGFTDTEHEHDLTSAKFLYEQPSDFREVYECEYEVTEDDEKNGRATFAGTRRGLRQIIRFGDLNALRSYFSNHPISKAEVETFRKMDSAETKTLFERYHQLREDITTASRKLQKSKRDKNNDLVKELSENLAIYPDVAIAVAKHDFHANAARLTDHVRLHRVLVLTIARLLDYAATWERDRAYAFFGMLYRHQKYDQLCAVQHPSETDEFGDPRLGFETDHQGTRTALQKKGEAGDFIALVKDKNGWLDGKFDALTNLLPKRDQHQFERAFGKLQGQSEVDKAAKVAAERKGDKTREFPAKGDPKRRIKVTIRNELAHMGTMELGSRIQLTYLVNAVRSLMAYDQKQKNAIVKSIKRILAEEGLAIEWRMKEDRLSRPVVYPLAEEHLKMVSKRDAPEDPVLLPRASVRLTSMVQALFDFSSSGHAVKHPKDAPTTKVLSYPDMYFARVGTKTEERKRALKEATDVRFAYEKGATI